MSDRYFYDDFKASQVRSASSTRIYGNALETSGNSSLQAEVTGWKAVRVCLCVQDAPDSRCNCKDPIIAWLSRLSILNSGKSDRKTHDGRELEYFDVSNDHSLLIERLIPVRPDAMRQEGLQVVLDALGTGGVAYGPIDAAIKAIGKIIAAEAIKEVGKKLGESLWDVLTSPIRWPPVPPPS